jgi:MazG family protein
VAASPAAADEFARLVEILRVLRSDEGCPWDREQSLQSLAPYVIEEAHEAVDAIERGDLEALRGEIGDVIFEGVFLAQLTSEEGRFSVADALHDVCEKLIRRHPHVFAQAVPGDAPSGAGVDTPDAVKEQWDVIKARERQAAGGPPRATLDGIPRSLPALPAACEIGKRVAKVGFDWPRPGEVIDKIDEEVHELRHAVTGEGPERVGDLLFSVAQLARKLGVDPEAVLRAANRKFEGRFRALEARLADQGRVVGDVAPADLERIWQEIKDGERSDP